MSNQKIPAQDAALLGCALSVAPAAMGCALGILLGDRMSKRGRQGAAVAMFAVGAISAMPYVVDYVTKALNGPGTERGQRKRQKIIRDGAIPADPEFYELEEVV